jgi:hypothetical protein
MVNLIDSSYFEKGNLFIPNNKDVNTSPVGSPTNESDLDFFVVEYERQFLLNALGITLYEELQVALLKLPFSEDTNPPSLLTASQKWVDLVNGITYTNPQGVKKRWDGLKGFNKQSVIAFFIYMEYLRNYNERFTTVGVVRSDAQNATNYDATPKYIKAYQTFLEQYQSDVTTNPVAMVNEFSSVGLDWFGSEKANVSLLQFLTDSNDLDATAFPDFEFKLYREQNSFGI